MHYFDEPAFATAEESRLSNTALIEKASTRRQDKLLKDFHSINNDEYSIYALPSSTKSASSGGWIGSKCHCLDCELLSHLDLIICSPSIALLDDDNISVSSKNLKAERYLSIGVFLWGFCNLPKSLSTDKIPFTPCGPENQAVDLVILMCIDKLRKLFPEKRIVVVTMDKPLQKACLLRGAIVIESLEIDLNSAMFY